MRPAAVALAALSLAFAGCGGQTDKASVTGRHLTFMANCGSMAYLRFRSPDWSSGCTGGSANLEKVVWRSWTRSMAVGAGRSLVRIDVTRPLYETRGKARFYRPETCDDRGTTRHFFSRVDFSDYYRPDNPFGFKTGWRTETFRVSAFEGECRLDSEPGLK